MRSLLHAEGAFFVSMRGARAGGTRGKQVMGPSILCHVIRSSPGFDVPVVDVGLGCGVPYLEKDRALDYNSLGEAMRSIWKDPVWDDVEIWSEAGRALVGQAGYYVSRVTEVK